MTKKLEINPGHIFPNKHWRVVAETDKRKYNTQTVRQFICECLVCNGIYVVQLSSLTNPNTCFSCKICAISGVNNPSWKGGITSESATIRKQVTSKINPIVKERDNYVCQKCGSNKSLNCHHIYDMQNYPSLYNEPYNLISLCEQCHMNDFHVIYLKNKPNTLLDLENWMGADYKYRNELLELYERKVKNE